MADDELSCGSLEHVLAAIYPDQPVEVVRRLEGRSTNGVYEIRTNGDRLLLKVTDRAGWRLEKEAAVLQELAPISGVSVPAVLDHGQAKATQFLLTEFCEGQTAVDARPHLDARPFFRALGQTVGRIHQAIGFAHPGNPIADDGGLRVEGPADWVATREELLDAEADILRGTVFESAANRAKDVLMENSDTIADPADIRLLHSDLNSTNVFVNPQQTVSCVIDWEYATAGDPVWDLASIEWTWFDDGPFAAHWYEAVIAGYTSIRDLGPASETRRRVYRAILPLGTMVGLAGGSEAETGAVDAPANRIQELDAHFERGIAGLPDG